MFRRGFSTLAALYGLLLLIISSSVGAQSQPPSQPAPPAPRPAAAPPPLRPPTRADILRGEYGRYRANNDLLSYRLDIRVDPEKKSISGTNTIRFRMLEDDTRIQLELYDNLAIDGIRLGATALKYERELNTVFVDFPATLKAGRVYAIDFHYSGNPREQGRFGGIAFRKDPDGKPLDQHRVRRRRLQHLVAEQGSVARRGRGDGDARRGPERSRRRLERQVRRQDRSRRRLHALGLARPVPDQQLQRLAQHRQLRPFRRSAGRPAARLLRAARQPREGEGAVRPGQADDRGV